MSKQHQRYLFQDHVADLETVVSQVGQLFICPICLEVFEPDSIEDDLLDVGHVWPRYFRQRSEQASHQQVLLCRTCNSYAGRAGDERMQAFARFLEGQQTGDLGLRHICITKSSGRREPLYLEAFVRKSGATDLTLGFPRYRKRNQRHFFEQQRAEFHRYAQEDAVDITVYPPRGSPSRPFGDSADVPLAQSGLLTSGYLLAFYTYGYRYILQTCLDPIRAYIMDSFERKVDRRLDFDDSKNTCVTVCSNPTHFCTDPTIGLTIAIDEGIPLHLEISFLNFHIRLPVPPVVLAATRRELILQLLGSDQLPLDGDQTLSSISFDAALSTLDHPKLAEAQLSKRLS